MYDNMSERGRRRWRPSLPRSHFVAPAPIVHDGGRRARNRQMKWEFMPPLSLRSSPPLHSVLRTPPIWLSLTASLTHHPELALLLHHAGHGDGGAGVGAHHRVVRSEEVHVAAGTAFQSGGAAQKHRRRPGSCHGVRNGAAIRP